MICANYKLIDTKLDLGSAMRKPYRKRKVALYESIEALVESRNAFVHAGQMDRTIFDKQLQTILKDIVVAADRAYVSIGYDFFWLRSDSSLRSCEDVETKILNASYGRERLLMTQNGHPAFPSPANSSVQKYPRG